VAREIGALAVLAAIGWLLIGAPGVPAIAEFARTYFKPRLQEGMFGVIGIVSADFLGQAWYSAPPLVQKLLRFPAAALGRLVRATVLLSGIGTIGIAALLPGAFVVHLLGLNAG
jgi:hypothetical protein